MNSKVGSPSRSTGWWGFVGFLEDGTRVPIGVYSTYHLGSAEANRWMKMTKKAARWEGEPLHEELLEDDNGP